MKIEYRQLQPRDYDAIVRLWQSVGLPCRTQGRDSRENITAQMAATPHYFIGAFLESELIGTAVGSYDGRRGCVNRLAVSVAQQRQGIARRLVDLCEQELRKDGANVIFALIDRENEPSQTLFKSLGYHFHQDIFYFSKRDDPHA